MADYICTRKLPSEVTPTIITNHLSFNSFNKIKREEFACRHASMHVTTIDVRFLKEKKRNVSHDVSFRH